MPPTRISRARNTAARSRSGPIPTSCRAIPEKEAWDFYNHYVHEHGDWEAATNLTEGLGINAQTVPPEALDFLREHFIAGWAGWPVIGTKEQIVDTYLKLADTGIDGVLTSWARYREGMEEFATDTYPLMVEAGLR